VGAPTRGVKYRSLHDGVKVADATSLAAARALRVTPSLRSPDYNVTLIGDRGR